ncbi:thioredoxin family protein [Microbacterium sp. NPDC091313]
MAGDALVFELYSSSFCGACQQTRRVLDEVARLVPAATVVEHNVATEPALAEERDIDATPTVIVHDRQGREAFRARGVPTIDQVLTVAAKVLA